MGRVCPPLMLTMVMLRRLLVKREGIWLQTGRDDGDVSGKRGKTIMCKIKKDVCFHVSEGTSREGGERDYLK